MKQHDRNNVSTDWRRDFHKLQADHNRVKEDLASARRLATSLEELTKVQGKKIDEVTDSLIIVKWAFLALGGAILGFVYLYERLAKVCLWRYSPGLGWGQGALIILGVIFIIAGWWRKET